MFSLTHYYEQWKHESCYLHDYWENYKIMTIHCDYDNGCAHRFCAKAFILHVQTKKNRGHIKSNIAAHKTAYKWKTTDNWTQWWKKPRLSRDCCSGNSGDFKRFRYLITIHYEKLLLQNSYTKFHHKTWVTEQNVYSFVLPTPGHFTVLAIRPYFGPRGECVGIQNKMTKNHRFHTMRSTVMLCVKKTLKKHALQDY
jgi:hypothetical protein